MVTLIIFDRACEGTFRTDMKHRAVSLRQLSFLFVLILYIVHVTGRAALVTVAAVTSDEHEFCQWENFTAECRHDDQVLLIQSAYYGRFILGGRCIDSSYGRMDCGRDVTDVVARKCSARRRCAFPVTSLHASSSSSGTGGGGGCPRDLTAHLLVKYTCLKGEEIELVAC